MEVDQCELFGAARGLRTPDPGRIAAIAIGRTVGTGRRARSRCKSRPWDVLPVFLQPERSEHAFPNVVQQAQGRVSSGRFSR